MTSSFARLLWTVVATLVALVAWSTPALAQGLDLTGNVDANEIELGDTITYTLEASTTSSEAPSDPRL